MVLKLGIQHRALKLYKVCLNDDPGLTMGFLFHYSSTIYWSKNLFFSILTLCLPVTSADNLRLNGGGGGGKLAANDQIDIGFMFMKKFDPRGLSASVRGCINVCVYMIIVLKQFFFCQNGSHNH